MDGNTYPKLHNAMWPGLVGKGPDSEPPIDLDDMLRLTAAARSNGAKFEGVDLFLADPHIIDRFVARTTSSASPTRSRGHGLAVGSVVAPVWPPVGGGSAMGSADERKQFVDDGRQGLPHRAPAARHRHSTHPASCASIRRPACMIGRKHPGREPEDDRQDLPRGVRHRRGSWRAPGRRRRNLLGRHAQLEAHGRASGDGRPAENARLPGRHGAYDALHAGLQRARAPPPAQGL